MSSTPVCQDLVKTLTVLNLYLLPCVLRRTFQLFVHISVLRLFLLFKFPVGTKFTTFFQFSFLYSPFRCPDPGHSVLSVSIPTRLPSFSGRRLTLSPPAHVTTPPPPVTSFDDRLLRLPLLTYLLSLGPRPCTCPEILGVPASFCTYTHTCLPSVVPLPPLLLHTLFTFLGSVVRGSLPSLRQCRP